LEEFAGAIKFRAAHLFATFLQILN
jgi:hypothetical protein